MSYDQAVQIGPQDPPTGPIAEAALTRMHPSLDFEVESAVVVLFAALPSAPSAYILARQLGADAPLAAVVITVETLAAMLTLPLVVLLCAGPHS